MAHVLHEMKIAAKNLPGRRHKMVFGPYDDMLHGENLCGGVAWFPADSHAPEHVHDSQEEVIYILTGFGAIYFDGTPEEVQPGCFVSIPCGVAHSIRNDADEDMKLLYVFNPPVVQGSYDKEKAT